jgi:hypothetical protein
MILGRVSKNDGLEVTLVWYTHGVNERRLALEAVGSSFADLIQKIIEWYTKHQNLQNLAESITMPWES